MEHLHTSTQASPGKSDPTSLLEKSLNFVVAIKKISNATNQEVGSVLLKIPVAEKFSTKLVYRALQKHIKRQITLMRNIRVEFQILIGSFQMPLTPELLRKLTKASSAIPTTAAAPMMKEDRKEDKDEETKEM